MFVRLHARSRSCDLSHEMQQVDPAIKERSELRKKKKNMLPGADYLESLPHAPWPSRFAKCCLHVCMQRVEEICDWICIIVVVECEWVPGDP